MHIGIFDRNKELILINVLQKHLGEQLTQKLVYCIWMKE